MLTHEEKTRWLQALRSGAFAQRRRTLGFQNTFCCLGVYCQISQIPFNESNNIDGDWDGADGNDGIYSDLSEKIGAHHVNKLINMNDNDEPFTKIADYIEKFIPCL